ncbi:hypothetical protein AXA84_0364 [Candidatus Phytoplasma oryzae]|nr:hypothetical protein AXA84_0364 [Candidatus Phytoplasma oryzae]
MFLGAFLGASLYKIAEEKEPKENISGVFQQLNILSPSDSVNEKSENNNFIDKIKSSILHKWFIFINDFIPTVRKYL